MQCRLLNTWQQINYINTSCPLVPLKRDISPKGELIHRYLDNYTYTQSILPPLGGRPHSGQGALRVWG